VRRSAHSSKHENSGFLDPLLQAGMNAVARHNVGFSTKNFGRVFLHVDQLIETKLSALVIEKQINVRIGPRVITGRRAEQVEVITTPNRFSSAS
jgi:hypothetical protein